MFQKLAQSRPTLFQILISVLSAFIGVQGEKSRKRDFQAGHPAAYIIVGIILTIAFVLTISLIVKLVLSYAT